MKRISGLTLIELIVVLAIAAILLSMAGFGMQSYVRNNRIISQTNSLSAAIQLARSEAIKRSSHVYICGSSNQTSCNTSNWHSGWIVFADPDRNAVDTSGVLTGTPPTGSDIILNIGTPFTGGTTARSVNFPTTNYVRYTASGRANSAGSFIICDNEKNVSRARALNIATTGLMTLAVDTDTTPNGIVDLTNGTDVTCP